MLIDISQSTLTGYISDVIIELLKLKFTKIVWLPSQRATTCLKNRLLILFFYR